MIGCGITGHPSEQLKCRNWPQPSCHGICCLLDPESCIVYLTTLLIFATPMTSKYRSFSISWRVWIHDTHDELLLDMLLLVLALQRSL